MGSQDKIYIRKMTSDDAVVVMNWENNSDNWEVSDNDSTYTLYDIKRLVDDLEDVKTAKQARYIICLKETDTLIGAVDLFSIDFVNKRASIGVLIADEANRRKGFALKSLLLLEEEAGFFGIDCLKAEVHCNNTASLRLFEVANYKKIAHSSLDIENSMYIKTQLFEKCLKK